MNWLVREGELTITNGSGLDLGSSTFADTAATGGGRCRIVTRNRRGYFEGVRAAPQPQQARYLKGRAR